MKRYAIVRVDNKCPAYENINLCDEEHTTCEDCKVNDNYGDTKEQMILKVAQVILRKFLKGYLGNAIKPKLAKEQIEIVYKNYLAIAKEIVEFLGVE